MTNFKVFTILFFPFLYLTTGSAQNFQEGDSTIYLSNKSEVNLIWSRDTSYLIIDDETQYSINTFSELMYFDEIFTADHQVFIVLCVRKYDEYYYYLYGLDKEINQWVSFTKSPLASIDSFRFEYEYVKISYRNPFVYRFYTNDQKRYRTYIVNNGRSHEIKEEADWFFFKE